MNVVKTNIKIENMKLTYFELLNPFTEGLREIGTVKCNGATALKIAKSMKEVQQVSESYFEARKHILESRANMINGKPEIDKKTKEYIFPSPEVKAEALELVDALLKTEVEIKVFPIKLADIGESHISGKSLFALKEFVITE